MSASVKEEGGTFDTPAPAASAILARLLKAATSSAQGTPPSESASLHAEVQALPAEQRAQLRAPLSALLVGEPPKPSASGSPARTTPRSPGSARRRRLSPQVEASPQKSASSSSSSSLPVPPGDAASIEAWLPLVLAAALPLLSGALPRDDRGFCVVPHPHALRQRKLQNGRRQLTDTGCIVFDTRRACDNCDRPIVDRTWYACAEGCSVDFCNRCHSHLEQLFQGRDVELAVWAAELVTRAAAVILCSARPRQRQALIRVLAFDWPLPLFQDLVQAVADVASAKVVHLEDGCDCDMTSDVPFWHIVGLLQLLRLANDLPSRELRFGELAVRGPRMASSHFVLGAIDKCDASAEYQRWKKVRKRTAEGQRAPDDMVLQDHPFVVSHDFAQFLTHGCLVPIGFRQRCLLVDAETALQQSPRRQRGLRQRPQQLQIEVPRQPEAAVLEAVVATLGSEDCQASCHLAVKFVGEVGRGLGVTREFLHLAMEAVMKAKAGEGFQEGVALWEYSESTRTFWFAQAESSRAAAVFRSAGVLLGQALLTGTSLQVAFPGVLFNLLLKGLGSSATVELGLTDLATFKPELAKGLQDLLSYEGEDVAEVFTLDWPRAGELTKQNRAEHVEEYLRWFFTERHQAELWPLCQGFAGVVGASTLLKALISPAQLEQIICGAEEAMDVQAVKVRAELHGWLAEDTGYLESFWDLLAGLSDEQRRAFAIFVSACGRRPAQGWQDFELKVQKNGDGDERLPTAYTCFSLLLLPRYSSAEVLRSRLLAAVSGTEGFGLS
eukprot:TRINITY_DN53077_c0_g1_i1.p1 TRINITY_DN53077_c0_g1~~TRINITY_DN53077_c0_g1_i1.p1  ORF type:complete len:804 (+),score=166.45 TRINITY_DN53077_c0_g1_i1:68-2413(+)